MLQECDVKQGLILWLEHNFAINEFYSSPCVVTEVNNEGCKIEMLNEEGEIREIRFDSKTFSCLSFCTGEELFSYFAKTEEKLIKEEAQIRSELEGIKNKNDRFRARVQRVKASMKLGIWLRMQLVEY